jgi:hypothetical protein
MIEYINSDMKDSCDSCLNKGTKLAIDEYPVKTYRIGSKKIMLCHECENDFIDIILK